MDFLKYLREKIPWYPTIDADLCRADLRCLNFCPYEVFEWDANTGQPVVAHPFRCLPGCEICLDGCDAAAITLPSKQEIQVALRRLRGSQDKPLVPAQL